MQEVLLLELVVLVLVEVRSTTRTNILVLEQQVIVVVSGNMHQEARGGSASTSYKKC